MLRHRLPSVLVLGAVLLASDCKKKPAEDEASIRRQLERKGTIDLMDQVAKAPDYKPVAGGRLTERQVAMYLAVRRRERKIREVAAKSLSPADAATADLRAAQELGFNPKEYRWVRDRVMEARMLQASQALHQQVAASREALLRSLAEQRKTADPARQTEIDRHVEDLRESANGSGDRDPSRTFNAQLLARSEELRKEPPNGT
jgi:hypothetical protein